MKKLIAIIVALVAVCSCYKVMIIDETARGHFEGECSVGDSSFYYMNCDINEDIVKMQLVKREIKFKDWQGFYVDNEKRQIERDTVLVLIENYTYSPQRFKYLLNEINAYPREAPVFKFSPNMYCSWDVFDKMYNMYVK